MSRVSRTLFIASPNSSRKRVFLHLLHVSIVFPIVSNCCLFHFIQWAFQWCDKVALAPGAPAPLPLSLLETNFISNFRSLRSASVNWIQHFTIQYCFFAICFILRSCFAIVSNCYPLAEISTLNERELSNIWKKYSVIPKVYYYL